MKLTTTACAAALVLSAALTLPAPPAAAQIAASPSALGVAAMSGLKTDVRWRGRGHHWRGHRGHWRGGHYRRGWRGGGAGIAAGLATGALIGGALAAQNSGRMDSAIQYCINRFKSYDVASQTYLGYDGERHACP